MDKDSLKPESNEYSKSGSDSKTAAATEEAAFDPDTTRPETEHDQAGKETKGTDVSTAQHPYLTLLVPESIVLMALNRRTTLSMSRPRITMLASRGVSRKVEVRDHLQSTVGVVRGLGPVVAAVQVRRAVESQEVVETYSNGRRRLYL